MAVRRNPSKTREGRKNSSKSVKGRYEYAPKTETGHNDASFDPDSYNNSVPQLIKTMSGNDNSKAIGALSKLSLMCGDSKEHPERDRKKICSLVTHLGGPIAIVSLMRQKPTDRSIQALCCRLLQHLSTDKSARSCIISVGGIQLIFKAMQLYPFYGNIQEWGLGSLDNFLLDGTGTVNQMIAYKCDAISTIVSAMKRHPKNHDVQQTALRALRMIFDRGDEEQNAILQLGGLVLAARAAETQRKTDPSIGKAYNQILFKFLKHLDKRSISGCSRSHLLAAKRKGKEEDGEGFGAWINHFAAEQSQRFNNTKILSTLGDSILSGIKDLVDESDDYDDDRDDDESLASQLADSVNSSVAHETDGDDLSNFFSTENGVERDTREQSECRDYDEQIIVANIVENEEQRFPERTTRRGIQRVLCRRKAIVDS